MQIEFRSVQTYTFWQKLVLCHTNSDPVFLYLNSSKEEAHTKIDTLYESQKVTIQQGC